MQESNQGESSLNQKKIKNFSFTVDNNLETGRSIIHDINFMYSTGQTITTDIEYEDGTTESFSYHKPSSKFKIIKY